MTIIGGRNTAKNACSTSPKLANGASCLVNINCDLGEGLGNDAELMPYLHSCSIACGGHAGDAKSIRETVKLAIAHDVEIGAHPSFDDRQNFGRLSVKVSRVDLTASLVRQIKLVSDECIAQGVKLHHVKPHGALYNLMCEDQQLQAAIEDAVCEVDPELPLYAPPFFTSKRLRVVSEGFADRAYTSTGRLRPRGAEGAVIEDVNTALAQTQALNCETICVHGDNPAALEIVKHLSINRIPVCGHIGYMPQINKYHKSLNDNLLDKAKNLEQAGVKMLVMSMTSEAEDKIITNKLTIPTISFRSSNFCDGEVELLYDLLEITKISFLNNKNNTKKIISPNIFNKLEKFIEKIHNRKI